MAIAFGDGYGAETAGLVVGVNVRYPLLPPPPVLLLLLLAFICAASCCARAATAAAAAARVGADEEADWCWWDALALEDEPEFDAPDEEADAVEDPAVSLRLESRGCSRCFKSPPKSFASFSKYRDEPPWKRPDNTTNVMPGTCAME